jgi:hypothetical protein
MDSVMQTHIENEEAIIQSLPEKADLDVLQHVNDVVSFKGLKVMGDIFDDEREENKHKINAFATVTKFGQYLEQRKLNKRLLEKQEVDEIDLNEVLADDEPNP